MVETRPGAGQVGRVADPVGLSADTSRAQPRRDPVV